MGEDLRFLEGGIAQARQRMPLDKWVPTVLYSKEEIESYLNTMYSDSHVFNVSVDESMFAAITQKSRSGQIIEDNGAFAISEGAFTLVLVGAQGNARFRLFGVSGRAAYLERIGAYES